VYEDRLKKYRLVPPRKGEYLFLCVELTKEKSNGLAGLSQKKRMARVFATSLRQRLPTALTPLELRWAHRSLSPAAVAALTSTVTARVSVSVSATISARCRHQRGGHEGHEGHDPESLSKSLFPLTLNSLTTLSTYSIFILVMKKKMGFKGVGNHDLHDPRDPATS
jgi:hypothetical protein